ncbi:transcriptional regulator, luxR family [Streptomyces noursei ATCC 11455]|uniref:LuxR C-terminal-related transcriptional regulator n=1 Tax=Streptomyces noursei TaxID=1971 RepID=UPI00081C35E0|nr:transcriptional regulator, luxR family [Streptomyces noursei ATCC 11455]
MTDSIPSRTTIPLTRQSLTTHQGQASTRTQANGARLTRAELEVLQLLPSDLTLHEIATRRHVSANTISTQIKSIYRKLGVRRRLGAINEAQQQGFLRPDQDAR